ncbi:ecdysoneless-like protein [Colletotrichum sojae]|uniref:Ecdysoneless-like protein n=1 Tax=Colletotrichum sojae TaxID=2175907 RepID=A0A8H6JMU9_9PEZI|nr:ecdysoneless-like protein [Colletotrichum sojae]
MAEFEPVDSSHVGERPAENVVEYHLFLLDSEDPGVSRKQLSRLEDLRRAALQLIARLASDYIWQRDPVNLEVVVEHGLAYLRGSTDFGDAIEDEWLIVFILRELSRSRPDAWIRIFDNDGEFLLVEAANVLPKWLSPENDQYRVWINNGRLRIIPFEQCSSPTKPTSLTLAGAVSIIGKRPESLVHSEFIEAEAFYRLEKYPHQIVKSMHHSLLRIPRRLAYVLHQTPKAVAPAVESFYLRDALDLDALLSKPDAHCFPAKDLVTVSVKFTRVLFAQLRSQRLEPMAQWIEILQRAQGKDRAHLEMGMKLTCGFQIMLNNIDKTASREARQAAIAVEDLKEDGDSVLPGDDEINAWKDSRRDDDESWLDINYEEFERELQGRHSGRRDGLDSGFGDAATQADLRKIVSRFEAFLNNETAGLDGAEVDEMDDDNDSDEESDSDEEDEDKEVSFDELEFSRMMREMMGLAPAELSNTAQAGPTIVGESTTYEQVSGRNDVLGEVDEVRNLAAQFQEELKQHGALKIDAQQDDVSAIKGNEKSAADVDGDHSDSDSEKDDDKAVDVDYNLAKNLLESFKGQAGLPGPAGNILGMMGLQLPRDDDGSEIIRRKRK